jgi:hypothetical protein
MKILYSCLIVVLLISTYNNSFSQTNQRNKELSYFIASSFTDYRIGSGISFVIFQKVKTNKINIIQIISSNSNSKKILDSLFSLDNTANYFIKLKKGNYCLPIIHNNTNSDENETSFWPTDTRINILGFDNRKTQLPDKTILLRTIVFNLTARIIN